MPDILPVSLQNILHSRKPELRKQINCRKAFISATDSFHVQKRMGAAALQPLLIWCFKKKIKMQKKGVTR